MVPSQPDSQAQPLRSVFTSSLAEILSKLKISLVISTYQAGKVILVRHDLTESAGGNKVSTINTHFRDFEKPMGIAVSGNRLSIGGSRTVWDLRNIPDVARQLEPAGKHDACFLPRSIHITGDIDIHEMAWSENNELWMVNTRFCCLCTLDTDHSFNPRWRPRFVSALAPEDRCHLNGLAMVDGHPKFVTALGKTDTAGGWRADKANGGILIDTESNEILLHRLSMPHSPRWYRNKLWLLESGEGSLVQVDLKTGTWDTVVQLPGFTRGIDFIGPLAFIGLSQVRESATFSGIPLAERLHERTCGVWVVNIETAETLGFLRFESGVHEIFAVQILHGTTFPEMLEWNDLRIANSYVLPDAALSQVYLPSEEELADRPDTHFRRGLEYYQNAQLENAIVAFRDCLSRDPVFPNARYNLAVTLADAEELDEAIKQLRHVAKEEPERAEVYNALGTALSRRDQHLKAIVAYGQAIALRCEYAEAHFNLGTILLKTGDYRRGWQEYAWRRKTSFSTPFQSPHPIWDGHPAPDKTLLILAGQNAGDAVLFARYLSQAAECCSKLVLTCSTDLIPLFAAMPGISEVREPNDIQVSEYDIYTFIDDLPHIFKTTADNIPDNLPYINSAIIRRRKDDSRLKLADSGNLKVGLNWIDDSNRQKNRKRPCLITHFEPLFNKSNVSLYNLQNGQRVAEYQRLLEDIGPDRNDQRLDDFGDLVVMIDQLDLVITVNSDIAHIAGAMGKPVWTILNYSSHWCWGIESDTTPWYPTMRLFRLKKQGDWVALFECIRHALGEVLDRQ